MAKAQSQATILSKPNLSRLQDIRQTKEYACFMRQIGWQVEKINHSTIKRFDNKVIYAYIKRLPCLPFSILKILRYQKLDQNKLIQVIKKHRAVIIKKEPFLIRKQKQNSTYFKVLPGNKWPLTPTKTLWLDLRQSSKQLLANLKPKTRYNLKKALKNNLQVKIISGEKITEKQLQQFYDLWSTNKPHNFLFRPHFNELKSLIQSFAKKCFFVFSQSSSTRSPLLLAACLVLTSENMAFYWHNASNKQGKKLFAPTLCIWKAITESKQKKLNIFDFEGVWDERFPYLNKGWKGFTKFKNGFVNPAKL